MSAVDDLTSAVAKISTAVNAAVADIATLSAEIKAANTNNDPAIEDAATKLSALADSLNAAMTSAAPPPAP